MVRRDPKTPFLLPLTPDLLASRLQAWYSRNRRPLPWRIDPTPYRVWLSEIMLQQTTVAAALGYYAEFIEQFPTVESLAEASEDEVLALWAGLGYYSRARNLLQTARLLAAHNGGRFPSEPADLARLPGIGRYTAGAIASVAFGKKAAILDGNIRRVFSRLLAIDSTWDSHSTGRLWLTLERLVKDLPQSVCVSEFNQSLMELGALVCTPRSPKCDSCPLRGDCAAFTMGVQESIPRPAVRPAACDHHMVVVLVADGENFLMSRHLSGFLPKSLWGFPAVIGQPGEDLDERFAKQHGIRLGFGRVLGTVRHQITHRRLHLHVVTARLKKPAPEGFRWMNPGDRSVGRSSYVAKVLKLLEV